MLTPPNFSDGMAEFGTDISDDVRVHHAHLIHDHVVTIRPILRFLRNMYVFCVISALLPLKRDSGGTVCCSAIYF